MATVIIARRLAVGERRQRQPASAQPGSTFRNPSTVTSMPSV
ncbi:MAG: hypothetical protein U0232_25600 [Thermomicrobiales bacterium]